MRSGARSRTTSSAAAPSGATSASYPSSCSVSRITALNTPSSSTISTRRFRRAWIALRTRLGRRRNSANQTPLVAARPTPRQEPGQTAQGLLAARHRPATCGYRTTADGFTSEADRRERWSAAWPSDRETLALRRLAPSARYGREDLYDQLRARGESRHLRWKEFVR